MMLRAVVLAVVSSVATWQLAAATPSVDTQYGQLAGVREGNSEAFLGIPYAKPPVGALRWRPPEKPPRWTGLRDATHFAASCYQRWPARAFGPFTPEFIDLPRPSEDCLYLNVWRPADNQAQVPVLVWIHGGAFLGGSGAVEIYNGSHLAAQGIVVVSINYRVGPFGFLAHPGLSGESKRATSGNYGLLDMVAALTWVRDNVARFGGDPRAVTIAGQSAGAAAVNALIASPLAKGLFVRAIAQSGSGMGLIAVPLQEAQKDGVEFARSLDVETLSALRALPPEKIQAAVEFPDVSDVGKDKHNDNGPRLRFVPTLDHSVLAADPENPAALVPAKVPLMTGYTADESWMPEVKTSVAEFEKAVRARYGSHADRFLGVYPHATDAEAAASARLISRDRYMASLLLWTTKRTQVTQQPIYAYLFEHALPMSKPPSWGTFHTAEVPYVFGTLNEHHHPYTKDDWQVAAQLSAYWLNFIKRGDPNGDRLTSWRPVDPSGSEVMGLGDRPGARPAVSSPERLAAFRSYVEDGGMLSLF